MTFAEATALRRTSATTFAGQVPAGWDIAGATNGGYLTALVASAVMEVLSADDPVTITTHFFTPVRPGPVVVEVDELRRGRSLSTAAARLRDTDGRLLLAALATVGELPSMGEVPDEALAMRSSGPPELDPPEDCLLIEPTDTFPPPFMAHVRLRLPRSCAGFATGRPGGRAEMCGWFELPGDEDVTSLAALMAADAFPPPVFNSALPIAWTPTVELTVQLRARPSGGPLRCAFRTRFVQGRFLEADGELWDSGGTLVAMSRQLALVPRG
jgi:acyl-coenzyme A thioesterase PaaI-like protein